MRADGFVYIFIHIAVYLRYIWNYFETYKYTHQAFLTLGFKIYRILNHATTLFCLDKHSSNIRNSCRRFYIFNHHIRYNFSFVADHQDLSRRSSKRE